MSPVAAEPRAQKTTEKPTSSKTPHTRPTIEPLATPPPKVDLTASPTNTLRPPLAAPKPPAATIPPVAPAAPPATHAELLTMQSVYGNAAVGRAAAIHEAMAAPKAATTAPAETRSTGAYDQHPQAERGSASPEIASHHTIGAAQPPPAVQAPATATASKAPEKLEAANPVAAEKHGPKAAIAPATAAGPASIRPGAKPQAAAHATEAHHPQGAKGHAAGKADAHGAAGHEKSSRAAAHQAIAPVAHAIHQRAAGARKHSPAAKPITSADMAGTVPATEQTRGAAVQTVSNLQSAKTAKVRRDDFKAKLKDAIVKATPKPKTESEADDLMKNGAQKANTELRGQLATQKDAAAGPMASAASPTADVSPSTQPVPPTETLAPEQVGQAPAPVATGAAVPPPLPPERLDYSSDRAPTDKAMAEAGVTQEQLQQGNEPEFSQNLSARSDAEKHEAAVESKFRKTEGNLRDQTERTAHADVSGGLTGMQESRVRHIGKVVGQQHTTKSKHAAERQQVTDYINSIKNATREAVAGILTSMETEATKIFEDGLAKAEKAYKDTFENAKGGTWTWLTTWGDDWRELIENSLSQAREEYLRQVDVAVNQVADLVDSKLEEARQRVERGRQDVDTYVKGLHGNLAKYGADAMKSVDEDFNQMSGEIDQRRDALVNKLADMYKQSYDRMSAMEEKLREENKSLWDRIYDATVGLIKKILAFKDMLLNVLARAAEAIGSIIAHPINFLGNLVDAGKLGFSNFVDHILDHLKAGFMEWLFGAVAETGIQLPKNFDLEGILSLVLQILGLTYSNIRSRAVKILGEKVVKALETAAEIFKILITKGPAGLWEYIKEKIGDLKAMVIEKVKAFVMEKIIMAGITWVIGLLNPASAFFKACKAIYDIVMFFVEHGKEILDLVNAIIDSISSIAKGAIGAAANFVETSLARTIPVIIGFLAALLGVGGISEKIKEIIEAIRKPINEAIDWVINKAVDLVKMVGGLLGFGKKDEKKETGKEMVGAVTVKFEMDGAEHTLTAVPGVSPRLEMASENEESLSGKIDKAASEAGSEGSQKEQGDALKGIESIAKNAEKALSELPVSGAEKAGMGAATADDAKAKQQIQPVATALSSYGRKYHARDILIKAGGVNVGDTVVLISKFSDRARAWPVTVTTMNPDESFKFEGPAPKGTGTVSGTLYFQTFGKLWRKVESDADLHVQEHHKIPWTNQLHWNHPLRELSKVDLRGDRRNLMSLGGHSGPHAADYHAGVQDMMSSAYDALAQKTQAAADAAMGKVMAEIETRIADRTLKPYADREVWIP